MGTRWPSDRWCPVAEQPSLSVVVPTHDRREPLRRALEALAGQSAVLVSFEVVVAADACGDGTAEMLAGLQTPYVLRSVVPAVRGRAAACNAAVAVAEGQVL